MGDLFTNINQAISDFNSIKTAIINKGVDIPINTPTSEYAQKINNIETNIITASDEGILKKIFKYGLDYLCKNNFTGILTESIDILTLTKQGVYLLKPQDESTVFTNLPSNVSNSGILLNYQYYKSSAIATDKNRSCIYFPDNEDIILKHSWGGNANSSIQWLYFKSSDFNNEEYNPEIIKNVIKYSFINNFVRIISSTTENWNNITETGIYLMNPVDNATGLSMPNFPGSDIFRWGWIIVLNLNSIIFQIYYTNHYDSYTKTFTYREYKNGVWGNWIRITGNWTKE